MKITHRSITAATIPAKIPSPFDQYYRIISNAEFTEMTGEEDTSSIVEDIPGYEVEHIAWVAPKPEYDEALSDAGIWIMELCKEGNDEFIGYVAGDRIYSLDMTDIERSGILDDEEHEEEE